MTRNLFLMKTSGGLLPKVLGTLAVLAVVVLVVRHPADAARWVHAGLGWLGSMLDGLVAFLREVSQEGHPQAPHG